MKVWLHWVQGGDATWLEAAWDDESTAGNPAGYQEEVARVERMAYDTGYQHRVQCVEIPGVYELFEIPTVTAKEIEP